MRVDGIVMHPRCRWVLNIMKKILQKVSHLLVSLSLHC